MSFLLVPHQVSGTAATVWVGALDEKNVSQRPVRLELEGGNEVRAIELDASAWETWESFRPEDAKSYRLSRTRRDFDPSNRLGALVLPRSVAREDLVDGGLGFPEPLRYRPLRQLLRLREADHLRDVPVRWPVTLFPTEVLPARFTSLSVASGISPTCCMSSVRLRGRSPRRWVNKGKLREGFAAERIV